MGDITEMKKEIYDKFGFDRYGYNRNGYDRMGYDREGYDKDGYDKNGLNKQGINKLTGYDKEGYDRDGYDKDGYNREGIDRDGYNREGYDKNGYDKNGYNLTGYDKEGYDQRGYNKNGYNREGKDVYGFDQYGMNENGFNIYGISKSGENILGYFSDGFDADGYSIDGFSRDVFDEDGYHIYTGFNLKGYDREGYNINGIDQEGYDKEGYHYESGYNREGFDRNGYNRIGYDEKGYDQEGYNRNGYNTEGLDRDGFNTEGYNKEGYDKEGYDRRGYDINGFNAEGAMDPKLENKENLMKMDSEENYAEAVFFKKCEAQILGFYKEKLKEDIVKEHGPIEQTYMDKEGLLRRKTVHYDEKQVELEVDKKVNNLLINPYFAHIDYIDNPELYIGKQAVHGWITDWADERASLYYQYQMYIGNKDTELNLVRDIMFSDKKYDSYKDKYNKKLSDKKVSNIADERLAQIIESNQENKEIHDIIETIQQNQYEIITSDKNISSLILGCAGSGKTMILMHKIRYMKYNDQDLDMKDIIVISPTDILSLESRKLSDILQIRDVQQFNIAHFYEECCKKLIKKIKIQYEDFHVCEDDKIINVYYDRVDMEDLKEKINYALMDKQYLEQQKKQITEEIDDHIVQGGLEKEIVRKMYGLYTKTIKELNRASKNDIYRILRQIDSVVSKRSIYDDMYELIQILRNNKIFKSSEHQVKSKDFDKELYRTMKMVEMMDFNAFLRVLSQKEIEIKTEAQVIQIMQLFMEQTIELDEAHKVLDEWNKISDEEAKAYMKYIENALERMDTLEKKQEILQNLMKDGWFKDKQEENNSLKYDISFEKLVQLFEGTEETLDEIEYTPLDYFAEYDKLQRKKKRLMENNKNPRKRYYLFDTILDMLGIDYKLNDDICIPLSSAYEVLYLLYCYAGKLCEDKKYIFIDEFQDFSELELELIQNLYPNSIMNLFGDFNQCINKKGIKIIEEVPENLYEDSPKIINENYRNARQITEYVNEELGTNMLPVGLSGIQENVTGIPKIDILEDDRVAIITKDDSVDLKIYDRDVSLNFYSKSKKIKRGVYNVISVAMAKGLEFEKVIVIEQEMSKNQFYVACTRAIKELYVIPGNISDQTIKLIDKKDLNNDNEDKKQNKRTNRCLDITMYENSKITEILELFEGISSNEHYDRLILRSEMRFSINDGHVDQIGLAIERKEGRESEDGITFTELRKGDTDQLKSYLRKQFTKEEYKQHRETGAILKLKRPYTLKTKNQVKFGQYIIVGIYVKKYT